MTLSRLSPPFVRQAELADIQMAINGENCRTVFLGYDTGLGASAILRELAVAARRDRPVLCIYGSPSLSAVPFGVLAPFLRGPAKDKPSNRTDAFRDVLAALVPSGASSLLPLVIVDDAHAVDPATAELLVNLVLADIIILVASHLHGSHMPQPLPHLWSAGVAENIDVAALTRDQTHHFCQAMLQGPVELSASRFLWSSTNGNPLFLQLLVSAALEHGVLALDHGVWVYGQDPHTVAATLHDAVRQHFHGLSTAAEEALDLVALAEPVSAELVCSVSGKKALDEICGRKLVLANDSNGGELRLASPVYGEVIRHTVPPERRRTLLGAARQHLGSAPAGDEAQLRWIAWQVDCGLVVADDELMLAAVTACKLSQPRVALDLLKQAVQGRGTLRSAVIEARARCLMGDFEQAEALLAGRFKDADAQQEMGFGPLLLASTQMALGMAVALPESSGQDGPAGPTADREAKLQELLALSQRGDFQGMQGILFALEPAADMPAESGLARTFMLLMEAERLCAQGRVKESLQRSAEALAMEHSRDYGVFFLPEMIIVRQLATALCAGDLALAQEWLGDYFVSAGPVLLSFEDSANVARGMGCVRQGRFGQALEILVPVIESLRINDPQQLLGFCIAMAAYSAARAGNIGLASTLLAGHREKPALFLVTSHERAFAAAAREYITHDGGGLAELVRLADESAHQGSSLLELNALALAVELGELSEVQRLLGAAARVEGPWAAAMVEFGQETLSRGPHVEQRPPPALGGAPWYPGTVVGVAGSIADGHLPPKLTKRELQITRLAARGLSDRAIAEQLKLSLRTVEGHLYRAYAKLDINGRDQLAFIHLS